MSTKAVKKRRRSNSKHCTDHDTAHPPPQILQSKSRFTLCKMIFDIFIFILRLLTIFLDLL